MRGYSECPRCGQWCLEHLKSYSHCWECGYFPEDDVSLRTWSNLEFRNSKIAAQRRREDCRTLGLPEDRLNDDQIDNYYRESLARAKGVL